MDIEQEGTKKGGAYYVEGFTGSLADGVFERLGSF